MLDYTFSTDAAAPVCKEIIDRMREVNEGALVGYFEDCYTKKVREIMSSYFTKPVGIYFCTSGTASNTLAIKFMKNNCSSIITTKYAHSVHYEVGAIEYNTGCKLVECYPDDGKITTKMIEEHLKSRNNFNWAYPDVVMITQTTEFGTCYTIEELKNICDFCHKHGLYVYIDGARLANAMEYLNCGFKEILEETGVDIASFGGNKNGAMFGEMLIILNPQFDKHIILQQKQSLQLFSKSRFMAVQFLALLENELWRTNARQSNRMARLLEEKMKAVGFDSVYKVESNCVFFNFSKEMVEYIKQKYKLSSYEDQKFTRIATSWYTNEKDVYAFVDYIQKFDLKKRK